MFNLLVFFIRFAGVINSIGTDSAWKTDTMTDELRAIAAVIKRDFHIPSKKKGEKA
jgi:hypothetical protein